MSHTTLVPSTEIEIASKNRRIKEFLYWQICLIQNLWYSWLLFLEKNIRSSSKWKYRCMLYAYGNAVQSYLLFRTMGSQVIYSIWCVSCKFDHIWTHCKGDWNSEEWSQGYLWSSRVAICSCISNQSSSGQENCCCAHGKYNILLYVTSLL